MTSKIVSIFLLAIICLTAAAAEPRYDRALVHLDATHTIQQLAALGLEVEHGAYRKGVSITTDFSEFELQRIAAAGFQYEVIIRDVSAYYVNQNIHPTPKPESPAGNCGITPTHYVPLPANFTTGSMGGFYTYQEMLDVLDSMKARFPNLITARQQIDTFHSIEGRPLYWLRISNHPDSTQSAKPQILYTGVHHAREPAGLTDLVYYMWYLLENYNTNAEVKALLDNTEMYIMPCVNPDGYIYNQTTNPNGGGMWRKNRRLNSDQTYGVDLNRNYGFNWGYDNVGSSNQTSNDTYRGTAAFSEPEIQASKWFAEHHNFKIAVNYHTYSNMLVYPWGYQASFLTPDSTMYETFAATMTQFNGFLYGTGDQTVGYTTNGDSDDWMYGEQTSKNKIMSMTPESGDPSMGFWPPANMVIPVAQQNFDLIYFAHKFLLKYLKVTDVSSSVATSHQFNFKYQAQRLGFDSTGTYTISISSNDVNVTAPSTVHTIVTPALFVTAADSFLLQLGSNITNNSTFSFIVHVSNGTTAYNDTIVKKFVGGDTLYYNNCNAIAAFTPALSWGVTTGSYTSATGSITDSPNGNYPDNSDYAITLTNAIDLTQTQYATLLYQAKWQLEKTYDYTLIEASADSGNTWNALCGLYTNIGNNTNNLTQDLYDGYQNTWVQEAIDLNAYLGQKIKLRFHLVSDPAVNYDGFYFDDLTVLGKRDTANTTAIIEVAGAQQWHIYPNPTNGPVQLSPADVNGAWVTIYNEVGQVVLHQQLSNGIINMDMLQAGIYFVAINKSGYAGTPQKIVVTK